MDLRPIGISTIPKNPWTVLPEAETPLVVRFDTEMEKSFVERALQVYSFSGIVDGELRWEGRSVYFIPSVPWSPGIRYGLKISGNVIARDGRELTLAIDIPFYVISRSPQPYLVSFSPPDSASVGVSREPILELNFSRAMDSRSAENALILDIPGEKYFEWLDDYKTLRIHSDKALNPWTVYRWSIQEKALSGEGIPLAKEFSGRFITDMEREFLKVTQVIPLIPPDKFHGSLSPENEIWGAWTPAALNMEQGPGFGQGIGVKFNKAPDIESLRRAFSFAPPLSGIVEILSPVSAVFIPTRDPEPEVIYTLRISGALRDREGLRMSEDYTSSFKADVPFLKILSFSSGGNTISAPQSGSSFPVPVNTGKIIQFVIDFSLPFDQENPVIRQECVFRISLRPFFPATLPPVSLRTARWISSDKLLMEWEATEAGTPDKGHYYRLLIPGGSGGTRNGFGSYLKEDFILYLEAK